MTATPDRREAVIPLGDKDRLRAILADPRISDREGRHLFTEAEAAALTAKLRAILDDDHFDARLDEAKARVIELLNGWERFDQLRPLCRTHLSCTDACDGRMSWERIIAVVNAVYNDDPLVLTPRGNTMSAIVNATREALRRAGLA